MCSSRLTPAARQALTMCCGQFDVRVAEILAVALAASGATAVQDAREIDDRFVLASQRFEHPGRVHVGFDHVDGRQQDEVLRALAPARRHRDADALRGQQVEHVAPDEAGSADDEHACWIVMREIMAVLR